MSAEESKDRPNFGDTAIIVGAIVSAILLRFVIGFELAVLIGIGAIIGYLYKLDQRKK